jgi:hypothetical protein
MRAHPSATLRHRVSLVPLRCGALEHGRILELVVAVATGCLPPRAPSSGAGPGNFQPVKHGVALVLVSLCVVPLAMLLHLAALRRVQAAQSDNQATRYATNAMEGLTASRDNAR